MQTEFEKQLESAWPVELWQDLRVLVAVSGGADSVALLRGLLSNCPSLPIRIVVAHFNHKWRADESDADAAFVENLCCDLGVQCVVESAAGNSSPTEANAREQRYNFLRRIAETNGARYIATAHTADDQAETVLHRILRGTGIGGLSGIPRIRVLSPAVTIVRPLLSFRRREIEAYLAEIGQPFRNDSSNEDVTYTRNRIRNELMPQLNADFNSDTTGSLLRLADLAAEYQQLADERVAKLAELSIISESEIAVTFNTDSFNDAPDLIVRELFVSIWKKMGWPRKAMGHSEWQAILNVVRSRQTTITLPGKIECRQIQGKIELKRLP